MDFGKDSIAEKVVHGSFMLPIETPNVIDSNIEEVTRRLQSYTVPLREESHNNTIKEQPKIPLPLSYYATNPKTSYEYDSNPFNNKPTIQNDSIDDTRAILTALRTLQDRVGKLESEKLSSRQKITSLEKELTTTRSMLLHQQQINLRSSINIESE